MTDIQSRHFPVKWQISGGEWRDYCERDATEWPCDARVEGNRADANADLAEAAQDEVRALTLRADAAEREREALRAALAEAQRLLFVFADTALGSIESGNALMELSAALAASPDTDR